MEGFKFFSILVVAALLLAPATAQARGPRVSFSFNFFDPFFPCFAAPPPPPPMPVPVYVPYQPPPICVERQTIVREYYCPECYVEEITPRCQCGYCH